MPLLTGCMSSWGLHSEGPLNGFDYNDFADGSCNGTNAKKIEIKIDIPRNKKLKAIADCYKEEEEESVSFRVLNP